MNKIQHSTHVENLCLEAQFLFDNNKIDECEKLINFIIKVDATNTKANELLAYIFKNRNESKKALKHLNIACKD